MRSRDTVEKLRTNAINFYDIGNFLTLSFKKHNSVSGSLAGLLINLIIPQYSSTWIPQPQSHNSINSRFNEQVKKKKKSST
jgi:hypothetical protein